MEETAKLSVSSTGWWKNEKPYPEGVGFVWTLKWILWVSPLKAG
jgi:hypothetical protein